MEQCAISTTCTFYSSAALYFKNPEQNCQSNFIASERIGGVNTRLTKITFFRDNFTHRASFSNICTFLAVKIANIILLKESNESMLML